MRSRLHAFLRHQCHKLFGAIGKAFGYKMHHRATTLHTPLNMDKACADNNAPIFLKPVGPDDNIAGAGLILQRQKHDATGTSRTLAADH